MASDALSAYRANRRFDQTPEPRGRRARKTGHLYTIQKHAARRLHYDQRLELDGVLKRWAVARGPSLYPADKRLAVRTKDHPVDYAKFEGRVPEGNYGAGTVLLWDQGTSEPISDPHKGLDEGRLEFGLNGAWLKGCWALVRFHSQRDPKRENWLLIKGKDERIAHGDAVTETETTSVASARLMGAIGAAPDATWESKTPSDSRARHRGKPPGFSPPELPTLVDRLPKGPNRLFEMKFDGYRTLAATVGDQVRIYTHNGKDWTERYPTLARALAEPDLPGALLDGEVVAIDQEGRSDFGALQRELGSGGQGLSYFMFDLLTLGGKDLRDLPLRERKERLEKLLAELPRSGPLAYTDHIAGDGRAMYRTLCGKGYEGVVAKRGDSLYRSGRGHRAQD